MKTAPRSFSNTAAATSANSGASATISLLMPVKASMYGDIGHSGLISELHSSRSSPFCTRTMPISVIRSQAALPPVVSKSTNARVSAASIERQQGIVKVGPPVAKYAPRLPITPHFIQIERRGQHRFALPICLDELFTGRRRDE